MRSYFFILSIAYLLLSCKGQKFSNVRISTGEYNHNFFDKPRFAGLHNLLLYRSVFRDGEYHIDSIPNGIRKLTIFSLLTNDIERSINLQSDTLIFFDEKVYPGFTKGEDQMLVNIKSLDDTVFVGRNISGCFNHHFEKLVLYKKNNKLRVEYYSTEPYQMESPGLQMQIFEKDTLYTLYFKKFINNCKKLYKEPMDNYNFSTTRLTTYIRQGGFYYELPDINGWNGFNLLKNNLGIKPLFSKSDDQYWLY